MKRARKVLMGLLHPPGWVRLFAPPIVFAALALVFLCGQPHCAPAYLIYGMSAYCLTILLFAFPKWMRTAKAWAKRRIGSTAFGDRYLHDLAFRGYVGLYGSTSANALYTVFRFVIGIRYASIWSVSIAAYYLVLMLLRLSLLLDARRRERIDAQHSYRKTARLLFVLNLPMGGMILLMVRTDAGYHYPGHVIYLFAIYAFYAITVSVLNLIRYRRLHRPILSAAKALNLVSALMSILGLQTAMIAQFSTQGESFRTTMNTLTGGAVWLSVVWIAVYMLRRSKHMKEEGISPVNKSESKYFATAARMDAAFLELIEKKDLAYITVKEICERAGVNRSTFYLHYETIDDLLTESTQYLIDRFVECMPHDTVAFLEKLPTRPQEELYLVTSEYLTPYLYYVRSHRRLFKATVEQAPALRMNDAYRALTRHVFVPILHRFHVPPEDQKYILQFHINGLLAIIDEWLKDDCRDDIAHVISVMQTCIPKPF